MQERRRPVATPCRRSEGSLAAQATDTVMARMLKFKHDYIQNLSMSPMTPQEKIRESARAWSTQPEVLQRKAEKEQKKLHSDTHKYARRVARNEKKKHRRAAKAANRRAEENEKTAAEEHADPDQPATEIKQSDEEQQVTNPGDDNSDDGAF